MPNVRIVCKARCGRCATRRSACTLNRCCRVARRGSTEKRAPRVVRCMRIGRRVRNSTCPTNRRARMPMQPHGGDRVRGQTNMHDRALQIRNVSRVSIRAIRMPLAAAEIPCRARRSRAESRAAHCADESGRSTRFKPTQADSTPVRKPRAAVSQAAFARRRRCMRPARCTTRATRASCIRIARARRYGFRSSCETFRVAADGRCTRRVRPQRCWFEYCWSGCSTCAGAAPYGGASG
ncbi:hypothetical protein AK34_5463 [Burkholderia dolosa AU0158]|nr:hypothetical protein AK34_5463 [Burkholderia dolosa AU0158]VWB92421.1 hypothetical protein BDO18943_04400 [Burkholderia dolosa]